MARPAEKARSMLNKWVAMREAGNPTFHKRHRQRPHLAADCEHLTDAERFRGDIVREIAGGIAKIQNPALGEHELRELNDEINHKLREKWHWNKRIAALGGPNYNEIERQRQIEEGDTQMMMGGYRYFGAAKELPGVPELLEKQAARLQKKSQGDLYKRIDPDYFGWRDDKDEYNNNDDDDTHIEEHASNKTKRQKVLEEEDAEDYLDVPSPDEIAAALLEHKKKALLEKYSL